MRATARDWPSFAATTAVLEMRWVALRSRKGVGSTWNAPLPGCEGAVCESAVLGLWQDLWRLTSRTRAWLLEHPPKKEEFPWVDPGDEEGSETSKGSEPSGAEDLKAKLEEARDAVRAMEKRLKRATEKDKDKKKAARAEGEKKKKAASRKRKPSPTSSSEKKKKKKRKRHRAAGHGSARDRRKESDEEQEQRTAKKRSRSSPSSSVGNAAMMMRALTKGNVTEDPLEEEM